MAIKRGMTGMWDEWGVRVRVPVTVLEVWSNIHLNYIETLTPANLTYQAFVGEYQLYQYFVARKCLGGERY